MRIEAFSRGKIHGRQDDNEDALVVLPGLGYAVIDGVSDRSGRLFGDVRGGRFAARSARAALARFLADDDASDPDTRPVRLVSSLNAALRANYARLGLDLALADAPERRAGCAFFAALHASDSLTLVGVGDCGARIVGDSLRETLIDAKPLDRISTLLRREAWRAVEAKGGARAACAAAGEAAASAGLAAPPPGLTADETQALAARVTALFAREHPGLPADEVARMVMQGVAGQRAFANRPELGLGYGVVDGFGTPDGFIVSRRVPLAGLRSLELFTDGYFDIPETPGLDAFETAHAAVEAQDFDKLDRFASMKGSAADRATDDRSYLRVIF
jgi:hypothetical protein